MLNLVQKVLAQNSSAPTANQLGEALSINQQFNSIGDLVNFILGWLIWIAGILAFVWLVISGITYLTAGGNAEQAKKGQQGLINAVIGIIIVVLAFVILQAVNNLGNNG